MMDTSPSMDAPVPDVGVVLIGRNEGARLVAALDAAAAQVDAIVYVDSGSTDNSVAEARARGAEIVLLDTSVPFTAARARNAGLARLTERDRPPRYVQFIDGDCALRDGWIATATAFLDAHPDVVAVAGRRRERFPEATLYNRLIDLEWEGQAGEVRACGGDVLMRTEAIVAAGGYDPTLIAGEEPELCVRLRQAGWRIWRLGTEMTWHDADMTRFSQWWTRCRRGGHACAEGAAMHGRPPERHYVPQMRRAVIWGLAVPLAILAGLFVTPWAALLVLAYPARILRLVLRGYDPAHATFLVLGNFAEAAGVLTYLGKRLSGRQSQLIEYK
jgi:GT2 family glycosyltransferase